MKLIICFTLMMIYSAYVWAGANDLIFSQRNTTDTGNFTRVPTVPASNFGLLGFNFNSLLPEWWTLGSGLTLNGTVLDVVPSGGQVNSDWSANSGVAQILNKPTLATVATTGSYNDLTNKPTLSNGTVTNVGLTSTNLTVTGSPITSTGNITVNLPNTGAAGTYANVTTDAQGRVISGTNQSINDAPGRSLVTSTSSTGFQISATRNAHVCYEGVINTTSTIGGPAAASVYIETADTNSTTPSDWTTKAQQTYSNNITLAVVLNQVQSNNWAMCRDIPAGKYVRIRSGNVTGTASVNLNSNQQETLQ